MPAPVINLTPQNAIYRVGFGFNANDASIITDGVPFDFSFDPAVYGDRPFGFFLIQSAPANGSHGFKTPPTAINCELAAASVLMGDNPPIPLGNRVFIANDGRVVFRPGLVAAIVDAASDDLKAVTGVSIEAIIRPIYRNPTGNTPDYAPTHAVIGLGFEGVEFAAFTTADCIDQAPYINYQPSTIETPATIGPDPMAIIRSTEPPIE